jgi:hypothetical protein
MLRFRDVLSVDDRRHLRQILGESEEELASGTKRHLRVSHLIGENTYLAEDSLEAFKTLSQSDRERLISDVVWRLTCHVEGSITRQSGLNSFPLECGFRLLPSELESREVFCVVKRRKAGHSPTALGNEGPRNPT